MFVGKGLLEFINNLHVVGGQVAYANWTRPYFKQALIDKHRGRKAVWLCKTKSINRGIQFYETTLSFNQLQIFSLTFDFHFDREQRSEYRIFGVPPR